MAEPRPRRKLTGGLLALGAASAVGLFTLLASAWLLVPRCWPDFVLRRSPWVEPAMRAAAALIEHGEGSGSTEMALYGRIDDWDRSAMRGIELAFAIGGHQERRLCFSCISYLRDPAGLRLAERGIRDPDAEVRLEALRVVTDLEADARIVPSLVAVLDEPDSEVRSQAVFVLASMSRPEAADALLRLHDPRIPPLLVHVHETWWLDSGAIDASSAMARYLAAGDPLMLSVLRGGLSSTEPARRGVCARWLGRGGPGTATRSVEELAPILRDDDAIVADQACRSVIALACADCEPALPPILGDREASIRKIGVAALGRIHTDTAIRRLVEALADRDSTVRRNAYAAVRDQADPRAVEPLTALIAGASGETLELAVDALGSIAGAASEPRMLAFLAHPDPRVRWIAATQLSRFASPAALCPLTARLDDADGDVRAAAAGALARCGDPALAALRRAATDADPEVAEQARMSLSMIQASAR
jgi:HEAT repeat protein